ncbi:MAG: type II toxin-antitoxin system HipA family toxin [Steroidobacteraceae bacterium]|nr:type II toxin-antitoxin system HipA family toxin [Steroidobacteraceae bacterium]
MKKPPLNVFVGKKRVGAIARSDVQADTYLFGYRPGCSDESAVSLTMPIRVDPYDAMAGLLPIFEMNLPEGALKERLRTQFAKVIPEFDDLDLLQIVGAAQIGRLRYSPSEDLDESVPEQNLEEILTYRGSADLFAHLLERFATYSGISGIQPKVLVREAQAPSKLTHQGATHIVKTFDAEYPELAANEYICTQGAAAAGIKTARVRLSENRKFLVVDRFDLMPDGSYLGVEDFCVLDGRRAHGRYDGSYEGIAQRLVDFISPSTLARAREQYARMVAYACLIGNGDAHLKNFSVLYRHPEDVVELAPAYDIVSTLPYLPKDSLALTLTGSKQFPDRARLLRFIRRTTGRSEAAAVELLEQVADGALKAIGLATDYGKQHKDAGRFVERLIDVIRQGLVRLECRHRGDRRQRSAPNP